MMSSPCCNLEDLVAQTRCYANAIKRLRNLSTIDIAGATTSGLGSDSDSQLRWVKQVDSDISAAARAILKLGGPNDTALLLPFQRPELKTLYVQYELLKATLPVVNIPPGSDSTTNANAAKATPSRSSVPLSMSCQHRCRKCAKKASTSSSDTAVNDKDTDIPRPDPVCSQHGASSRAHMGDASAGSRSPKSATPDPPPVPSTTSTFGCTDEDSDNPDEIVHMQQAATLCEMLKDLGDDNARLTERIEGLRQTQLEQGTDGSDVDLEATVDELEYNFKLYTANNHSLEVAMVEVASLLSRGTDRPATSMAQRLFDLSAQAERLFSQNTSQGDVLGLLRDPRSSLGHSRGPLVLAA